MVLVKKNEVKIAGEVRRRLFGPAASGTCDASCCSSDLHHHPPNSIQAWATRGDIVEKGAGYNLNDVASPLGYNDVKDDSPQGQRWRKRPACPRRNILRENHDACRAASRPRRDKGAAAAAGGYPGRRGWPSC